MNAPGAPGPSRRQVLRGISVGVLGGAAAAVLPSCSTPERRSGAASTTTGPARRSSGGPPAAQRTLVVIELAGGNDGLSMVAPYEDGRYHDLRPTLALGPGDVVDLGGGVGLVSELGPLHARGLAVLQGVGARHPSLSHFDMLGRWWSGTPDASASPGPGFLGRLCDRLATGDGIAGVDIGLVGSPALIAARARTVGLPGGDRIGALPGADAPANQAYLTALRAVAAGGLGEDVAAASASALGRALDIDVLLEGLPPPGGDYPLDDPVGGEFAAQLSFAGQLLRAAAPPRVIHVSAHADFDTHESHRPRYAKALASVVPGLEAFRADLATDGLDDRVLIATTSEFGRRAEEHAGGLDHGTASCALLMGPVHSGLHGEPPSLRRLDRDGNQVATVSFDRYYATLASWLDVDPAVVLDGRPAPLDGLLVT